LDDALRAGCQHSGHVVACSTLYPDSWSQEQTVRGREVKRGDYLGGTADGPDRPDLSGRETGVQFPETGQQRLCDSSTGAVDRRLNAPAFGI
jgi:hypothetical protein